MTKFPVLPLAPSRNILIALSSGQGIQPWLMGLTEVAYGSKAPFRPSASHFRCSPINGHRETGPTGPVRANERHRLITTLWLARRGS